MNQITRLLLLPSVYLSRLSGEAIHQHWETFIGLETYPTRKEQEKSTEKTIPPYLPVP